MGVIQEWGRINIGKNLRQLDLNNSSLSIEVMRGELERTSKIFDLIDA